MLDCLFVVHPLDCVKHLPELRIGKIDKLLSENWSLPGQEQQLPFCGQIANLIRGAEPASGSAAKPFYS